MTTLNIQSDKGPFAGELFEPTTSTETGDGKSGALILIHEWWGLNDQIRAISKRFAGEGFVVLALDIFGGQSTADPAVAMKLANEMKTAEALVGIAAAKTLLASHARSNGKVGITGFCLGGAVALGAAFNVPGFAAALPFYGLPPAEYVDPSKASPPPIQGHYAKTDAFVDAKRVQALADAVVAKGGVFEAHFYDAGHAFMRDSDPAAYDEAAAKLAWSRAIPFLKKQLA